MGRAPNLSRQTRQLLAAFVLQPRAWRYGYDLSREIGLKSGTLYPLLIRLSEKGLLESQWVHPERPGKPPRHAYRLTAAGVAFARSMAPSAPGRIVGATS
jgi:DNA-binding PadR family transcriptional regulator